MKTLFAKGCGAVLLGMALAACASAPKRETAASTSDYYKPFQGGGRYGLNYPYYWGSAPAVGARDPYDTNGNYFPSALPER